MSAQAAIRARASSVSVNPRCARTRSVWPESVAYTDLRHKCDVAEVQEINALATQLESVKDASCEAYNQLLAKARAMNPPSVLNEAARRSSCNHHRSATSVRSRRGQRRSSTPTEPTRRSRCSKKRTTTGRDPTCCRRRSLSPAAPPTLPRQSRTGSVCRRAFVHRPWARARATASPRRP